MSTVTPPDATLSLSIFHTFYGFLRRLAVVLDHVPKKSRYTLGAKIDTTSLDVFSLILRANQARGEQRLALLHETSVALDLLKILIRLAKDTKSLSETHYILLQEPLQKTGKMLGGWIKNPEASRTKNPA